MLRFILTGLFLLQFQVAYSSILSPGTKPACFPTSDPISTNVIQDDPFCSKQPKGTFLIFHPKPLHRFQPLFLRRLNFSAPTFFENLRNPIPTPEKRITDICAIKSQGTSHVSNVPEVLMEVHSPPPPQETVFEGETFKQCPTSVDTLDSDSDGLSYEYSPEGEGIPSSSPFVFDNERQSSLNPSGILPLPQCPTTPGPLIGELSSLNPSSIISETDRVTSLLPTGCDAFVPKLVDFSEPIKGSEVSVPPCTTQINPLIEELTKLTQMSGDPACTQQGIPLPFPPPSISLDTPCENISSASTVETDEISPPLLNTACVSPTIAPILKESFSETLPTSTDLGQISGSQITPGITSKIITVNPISTAITNPCTSILSNMITGLSSISTKTSPSLLKPIYEELFHHVPTVRNVVRHHLVETTHHVPIVENIIQHERQDIIRHIPVIQKVTRNVVEYSKKNIPIVQHRTRIVEEPYIEHVPHIEKITRPVIETLVKHVPVVFSRYKPVVLERIRHVPTVETKCVPVIEETITTVPVKEKVIKHVVEDRITPIIGPCATEKTLALPSSVPLVVDHIC